MLSFSSFNRKGVAMLFLCSCMLSCTTKVIAQQPYLFKRLSDPVDGFEYPYSIDEVNGNILVTAGSYPPSSNSYAVCSFVLNPVGDVLFKDYLAYDSVSVFSGYRGSSIVIDDSIFLTGGLQWNQDSILPGVIGVSLSGNIGIPRLIDGGVDFGGFNDGVATDDGGMLLFGIAKTDTGYVDYLAVRVNAEGEIQWMKTYGTDWWDRGYSVCHGPDGGFFLGGVSKGVGHVGRNHIFIIRIDSTGKEIWRGDWGGYYDDWLANMEYNPEVGLLVVGSRSPEQGGPGLQEGAYAMLLNDYGDLLWDVFYNEVVGDTVSMDAFFSAEFIGEDRVLIVGQGYKVIDLMPYSIPHAVILDKYGNELMKRHYTSIPATYSHAWFEDVIQLDDGRIFVSGIYLPDTTNAQDTGNQDILIVELDENGCEYPGCQPPLGREEVKATQAEAGWKVYPNPAKDVFTLSCGHVSHGLTNVRIYNTAGQQVLQQSFSGSNVDVRVTDLATGVYILELRSEGLNDVWRTKLVVR
ncbi:MAG: T9SS type A sorting domain-containing protein [Flavobacteriales bacterium]|nr:T9SS type A sorting domain-containing protein [Flavobacteriales bacterium]